jgi:membrane-associated phospholipid phosphatase
VHLLAALLVATSAAPPDPAREPLPIDLARDLTLTGAAGAVWVLSQIFEKQLAPATCRWCDPPAFDASIRDALKWEDTAKADTASNVLAYGAMPLATLGADFLVSGRDLKVVAHDTLIVAESAILAGVVDQGVKFLAGRERPFVHALDPSQKPLTARPADNNVSFYSGHTSFTTAIAVSAGMCASLRGERQAWVVWATGVPLALTTGYLRIAADKHYASDVVVGAAMGGLFGVGIPLLLHRPQTDAQVGASLALSQRAVLLSGIF